MPGPGKAIAGPRFRGGYRKHPNPFTGFDPNPKRPFTRLEPWIVKSGLWACLTGTEAKLLVALAHFANNLTAVSCPTLKRLSDFGGVARSSIPAAMKRMEERGILERKRFGRRLAYRIK